MRSWKLKTVELEAYAEKLEPGDRALLELAIGHTAFVSENVWVRVFAQLHDGKAYLGTVEFPPAAIRDLKRGDSITFQHEHIVRYKKANRAIGGGLN